MNPPNLLGAFKDATHREIGGVKRIVYLAGFRWVKDLRPVVGGELCQHAHVGFLAAG